MVWSYFYELNNKKYYVQDYGSKKEAKEIHDRLISEWTPPEYLFQFKAGGHIAALAHHIDNNFFAKIDISGFFNAISATMITHKLTKNLKIKYSSAREIALKSTIRNKSSTPSRIVPLGYVQSNILASICFHYSNLGKRIEEVIKNHDCKITVYVDDIVVSSEKESTCKSSLEEIMKSIVGTPFKLNDKKTILPTKCINCFGLSLSNKSIEPTVDTLQKLELKANQSELSSIGVSAYLDQINKLGSFSKEAANG